MTEVSNISAVADAIMEIIKEIGYYRIPKWAVTEQAAARKLVADGLVIYDTESGKYYEINNHS